MSRLKSTFERLKKEKRPALVLYLTFGDPDQAGSLEVIRGAVAGGADIIEVGVPFSDPNADGVIIQEAMLRALKGGANLKTTLAGIESLRKSGCDVPIVLFGYYNPIFVMGVARFAEEAARAGVDAVLTVDVPLDELAELSEPLAKKQIDVVPLVAPTSTPARIKKVAPFHPPFVYYISRTGVTGAGFEGSAGGDLRIDEIRKAAGAPVCVGFGIKTPEDVKKIGAIADGVVVGSAAVQRVAAAKDGKSAAAAIQAFVKELRSAL